MQNIKVLQGTAPNEEKGLIRSAKEVAIHAALMLQERWDSLQTRHWALTSPKLPVLHV